MSAKYHPGEIEVQERAGVRSMAERVGNSIHPIIPPAAREFLEEQPMVVVGSLGADGRVRASLLVGEPGFMQALDERTVKIDATPFPGDPLAMALQGAGTKVGVLAIDLAARRRLRLNGEAERRPDAIYVRTYQATPTAPSTSSRVNRRPAGPKPVCRTGTPYAPAGSRTSSAASSPTPTPFYSQCPPRGRVRRLPPRRQLRLRPVPGRKCAGVPRLLRQHYVQHFGSFLAIRECCIRVCEKANLLGNLVNKAIVP